MENIHEYIRMYLDYSDPGVGKVSMIKYLQKFINAFS